MNNKTFVMLVGDRLRQIRKNKGLTIEELANRSGVDYSYLCKVEKATVNCTLHKIQQIAEALDVEPLELFDTREVFKKSDYIDMINSHMKSMNERQLKGLYDMINSYIKLNN